jgi:hypothetical protein
MFDVYRWQHLQKAIVSLVLACFTCLLIYNIEHRQTNQDVPSQHTYRLQTVSLTDQSKSTSNNDWPRPFVQQRQSSDLLSLIDFVHSPYLDLKSFSSSTVPIVVLSKASNIEVRDAIRRTWAFEQLSCNHTKQIRVFFLVGTDDFTIERIRAEQLLFDDTIQVSIPDTNSFVAYKELAAMIWIRTYLSKSLYYFKAEDDIILNMRVFNEHLIPSIEPLADQHMIIGWFGPEHVITRQDYQPFLDALMPPVSMDFHYAMSLFYSVTSCAADRMLDALSHVDQIDQPGDIFLTGILRQSTHVQANGLERWAFQYRYDLANGQCRQAFEQNSRLLLCTSSLHTGKIKSIAEYFDAWNILLSNP